MKSSTTLSTSSTIRARRVLLLADRLHAVQEHVDPLLHYGYEVDCTYSSRCALTLSRTRTYDLILIALRRHPAVLQELCRELRQSNPTTPIASLVDPTKPIPPLHAHQFLWTREGEEYFMARVNALVEAC
jgi:CheY-like chemotaxis protein